VSVDVSVSAEASVSVEVNRTVQRRSPPHPQPFPRKGGREKCLVVVAGFDLCSSLSRTVAGARKLNLQPRRHFRNRPPRAAANRTVRSARQGRNDQFHRRRAQPRGISRDVRGRQSADGGFVRIANPIRSKCATEATYLDFQLPCSS
jgi:hypothetical protein